MKEIKCKKTQLTSTGWEVTGETNFLRLSNWLKVKHNYKPNKRNSLWYYVTDGNGYKEGQKEYNPTVGLYLDYFTFKGRNYAINQFTSLGNPFWCPVTYSYQTNDGKEVFLVGVDAEEYFNPLYIEASEDCEEVRVYVQGDQ